MKITQNRADQKIENSRRHPEYSCEELALHQKFVEYGRNAKEWLRKCALLLPEIDRKKIWKKRGFGSIFEYAGKLAGMSRSSVEDALRILKKIEDKRELRKVVEEKDLNAIRPIVAIATKETADFWASKASQLTKNTLEAYVREFKKHGMIKMEETYGSHLPSSNLKDEFSVNFKKNDGKIFSFICRTSTEIEAENLHQFSGTLNTGSNQESLTMTLDPEIAAELKKLKGEDDWNALMKELLELRKQKLEQEKPLPIETDSRHIPEKIKKFVLQRTRGQCAYPACGKKGTILHHTQRFALKNIHDPDRLFPLCKEHERIAHHGLIANEEQETKAWRILDKPIWWKSKRMIDQKVINYRTPAG